MSGRASIPGKISLLVMSLFYIGAGINHFIHPAFYTGIMPPYLPFHKELVYTSGVCEIVLGALVLVPALRKTASWVIIAMLLAFLPVHIHMIVQTFAEAGLLFYIALVRLPLQFILILWAYRVGRTS